MLINILHKYHNKSSGVPSGGTGDTVPVNTSELTVGKSLAK